MTEAKHDRRCERQRERRSRKQADHVLTGIVAAIGAGDLDDWQDEQQQEDRGDGE